MFLQHLTAILIADFEEIYETEILSELLEYVSLTFAWHVLYTFRKNGQMNYSTTIKNLVPYVGLP